jgi:hypothetical protein
MVFSASAIRSWTMSAADLFLGHEPDALSGPVRERLDVAGNRSGRGRVCVAVDWRAVGRRCGFVVFSSSGSGRRSARPLPRLDGRVTERAVWCVGPAAVEQRAVERVGLAGGENAAPVVGVDRGFARGQEPRMPACSSCGASGESGGLSGLRAGGELAAGFGNTPGDADGSQRSRAYVGGGQGTPPGSRLLCAPPVSLWQCSAGQRRAGRSGIARASARRR